MIYFIFCCLGAGGRPSAAVHQSHHSVGPGHAQEGPADLARQSSKVRLHREHQQRWGLLGSGRSSFPRVTDQNLKRQNTPCDVRVHYEIISTFLFMSHSRAHDAGWIPRVAAAICHSLIMWWISFTGRAAADGAVVQVPNSTACLLNRRRTFVCLEELKGWDELKGKWCALGKRVGRREVKNQTKHSDRDGKGEKNAGCWK